MPDPGTIALDATYSIGAQLSGVGVYSREILFGLAAAAPRGRVPILLPPAPVSALVSRRAARQLPPFPLAGADSTPPRQHLSWLNQRLPTIRLRRTVTTFHDLFVLTGDYSTPEFRRRFAEQAQRAAAGSDRIIAVSQFTAMQVEQLLGVERSRIRVVHHGVRIPPALRVEREKIILHVGAIQKRKNIARLLDAFERVLRIGVWCWRDPRIRRRRNPEQDRQSPDLGLGYVSAAELDDWYARAMILAFPRSTRDSVSPCSKPWQPACQWLPRIGRPWPRSPETPRCW